MGPNAYQKSHGRLVKADSLIELLGAFFYDCIRRLPRGGTGASYPSLQVAALATLQALVPSRRARDRLVSPFMPNPAANQNRQFRIL